MDCPKCKMPGAYLGFSRNECRNKKCDNYTETCERTCPVCGGAAGCPGFVTDMYAIPPFRHVMDEPESTPPAEPESSSPSTWTNGLTVERRWAIGPCSLWPLGLELAWTGRKMWMTDFFEKGRRWHVDLIPLEVARIAGAVEIK